MNTYIDLPTGQLTCTMQVFGATWCIENLYLCLQIDNNIVGNLTDFTFQVGQRAKMIKSFDNINLLQFLTAVASILLGVFEVLTNIYPTGLQAAYALLQLLYWLAHCGITISFLHCGVAMLRALSHKGEAYTYHLRKGMQLSRREV